MALTTLVLEHNPAWNAGDWSGEIPSHPAWTEGHFTVRLPDTLHHALEERAQHEGVSLNQYMVYKLTKNVTPAYTIQVVPDADLQQQHSRFQALLAQLGRPDRAVAEEFLATRPVETPEDAEEVGFACYRVPGTVQKHLRLARLVWVVPGTR